jgi:hypothetical protein
MLHIVFHEADISVLQKAIGLDEKLSGDVWQIKDEFAVGPVANIYETEGYQQRREWWKEVLENSPYTDNSNIIDDKLTVHHLTQRLLDEKEVCWIWMGQNTHDVCGYYWLMSQLKDYQGNVYVLFLNNLPFINEKGQLFYPNNLFEIQPKEFLKAKKLARLISLSEFETDPDEWKKLCAENAMIRTLEGGKKIVSRSEDCYDAALLNLLNAEPQKLGKLLHSFYSKTKIQTGDVFLVWRIKKLIEQNKIVMQGEWSKGWKDVTLALAGYKQSELYATEV